MQIRDRILELRRVPAGQLRPHPKNWRTHPQAQQDAMRGVLAEIGYADALLARELPDGSLELIDGHLRAEITPDVEVPVLVLDLDEKEAAKLLALHDPLSELAGANEDILANLLAEVETASEAVQAVLDGILASAGDEAGGLPDSQSPAVLPPEVEVPQLFQVVIECPDESQQKAVFERMTAEGYHCRLLNL
jgi:hypothetical protein